MDFVLKPLKLQMLLPYMPPQESYSCENLTLTNPLLSAMNLSWRLSSSTLTTTVLFILILWWRGWLTILVHEGLEPWRHLLVHWVHPIHGQALMSWLPNPFPSGHLSQWHLAKDNQCLFTEVGSWSHQNGYREAGITIPITPSKASQRLRNSQI